GRKKVILDNLLGKVPETSGACVVFVGVVRGKDDGKKIEKLEYTDYRAMALSELKKIAREVAEKYHLDALHVHHRVGSFMPGEPTVYIIAFAPHREECFGAAKEVIDRIKKSVPIWKKEFIEGKGKWK
ncbi:MAG: molybdopterin synthase catalytic subunit, partial [Thermoplasmata archaeon]